MILTLAETAAALDTTPSWVQNALSVLGRPLAYPLDDICRLGLARELHVEFAIMLPAAWRLAGEALAGSGRRTVRIGSGAGSATLEIDVARYLTRWVAALSRVRTVARPRGRGRPRRVPVPGDLAAARRYGIDVGLLAANLRRSPAERLRALDENWDFVRQLRAQEEHREGRTRA